MKHLILIGQVSFLSFFLFASGCRDDAEDAWTSVAKDCAFSELNADKAIFFGPSNALGPGSIWRQIEKKEGGGYRVRWDSKSIPRGVEWMKGGREFECQGKTITKLSGSASTAFASDVAPLSAELKSEFDKAKNIEVKVSMMRWDTILEGPFEQQFLALPGTSAVKLDLAKENRLVMYRALLVRGFEARLSFDTATAAGLSAKLKDGMLKPINGELGAKLNVKWEKNQELVLTSITDFYVAGELAKFNRNGFASASTSVFSKVVDTDRHATLGSEIDVSK